MTDKNPLDDVIEELNIRLLHPMAEADYNQGVLDAIRIIESHRTALLAGMRKPLRFQLDYEELVPNSQLPLYVIVLLGDKPVGVKGAYGKPQYQALRGFYTREYAMELMDELAQSLGMTAEFVDGESDE